MPIFHRETILERRAIFISPGNRTPPPPSVIEPPIGFIAAWDASQWETVWGDVGRTQPIEGGDDVYVVENLGTSGPTYDMVRFGGGKWVAADPHNRLPAFEFAHQTYPLRTSAAFMNAKDSLTICVVATGPDPASASGDSRVFNVTAGAGFYIEHTRNGMTYHFGGRGKAGDSYQGLNPVAPAVDGETSTTQIGIVQYVNKNIALYHENELIAVDTNWQHGTPSQMGTAYAVLGGSDSATFGFNGWVHAVYIYDRVLTALERLQWQAWVDKYWRFKPATPPPGALLAYDFSDTSTINGGSVTNTDVVYTVNNLGTLADDYDLTNKGNPVWLAADPISGKPALAPTYNDLADGLLIPNNTWADGLEAITVCAVTTGPTGSALTNDNNIIALYRSGAYGLVMNNGNNGQQRVRINNGNGLTSIAASGTVTGTTSQFTAADFMAGTVTMYRDNAQVVLNTTAIPANTPADYSAAGARNGGIGCSITANSVDSYQGYIHAVYVYDRILSPIERQQFQDWVGAKWK